MIVETEKMINMTKYIFKELEHKKVLNFKNLAMDAISFAFTIHGLMDYEKDCKKIKNANNQNLINEYISSFCNEHIYKEV